MYLCHPEQRNIHGRKSVLRKKALNQVYVSLSNEAERSVRRRVKWLETLDNEPFMSMLRHAQHDKMEE